MADKKEAKPLEHLKANAKIAQREKSEETCKFRSEYQRDRDRILYSKAFRRLKGKTQVFLSDSDDHIRTRLTHTLEVSQIARTFAKYLGLDEDLTEAIALGHDLGHTPFGHVGERILNYFTNGCEEYKKINSPTVLSPDLKGFKHNWQSARVVCDLSMNHNEEGLNLCYETIWGIINHSSTFAKKCEFKYEIKKDEYVCKLRGNDEKCNVQGLSLGFYEIYKKFDKLDYFTIEAICVSLADEIAQRHHDIEDGLYTKIIRKEEILEEISSLVKEDDLQREKIEQFLKSENTAFMSELSSFIINYYVHTVCNYLISYFSKFKKCDNLKELRESINDINLLIEEIDLSRIIKYDRQFQQFLMQRILYSHKAQLMDGKAYFIIKRLYKAYLTNPHQLPDATIIKIIRNYFLFYIKQEKFDKFFRIIKEIKTPLINNFFEKYSITELKHVSKLFEQGISREFLNVMLKERTHTFCSILLRTITDHIAGMTDKKAMEEYRNLYAIK